MDMKQYLAETEYATVELFQLIWKEEAKLYSLQKAYEIAYNQFLMADLDRDEIFPYGFAEKNFHDAMKIREQMLIIEAKMEAKETSITALASAVLQIAKQGLSIVHGNPKIGQVDE